MARASRFEDCRPYMHYGGASMSIRIAATFARLVAGLLVALAISGMAHAETLPPLAPTPNAPTPTAQKELPCGQVTRTAQGGFYVGVKHIDDDTVSVQAFQASFSSGNVYNDGWSYVEQCYSEKQANASALDWALFYRDAAGYPRVIAGSVHDGPINLSNS